MSRSNTTVPEVPESITESQTQPEVPKAKKKPKKGQIRTDKFKIDLQKGFSQLLGEKISKQTAWDLFKLTISITVESVVNDGRLPLQGVGAFEIIEVVPRKSKKETHNFAPKLKFRPSATIDNYLEQVISGVFKPGFGPKK